MESHFKPGTGMASYSFLWPAAGLTRSLYLKELYVAQDWQRQGIGLFGPEIFRVGFCTGVQLFIFFKAADIGL